MENDFSEVCSGDKVFHVMYGWGVVVAVEKATFRVKFSNEIQDYFWFNGKTNQSNYNPSIFWDEIIIIPPPKPKRKVEKIIEGWLNIYPNTSGDDDVVASSCHLYKSQKLADSLTDKTRRLGDAHHIIHKYTVEE